jgi:hypothetical protein
MIIEFTFRLERGEATPAKARTPHKVGAAV